VSKKEGGYGSEGSASDRGGEVWGAFSAAGGKSERSSRERKRVDTGVRGVQYLGSVAA